MRQVALIVGFSALACLMCAYPSTSGALSSALDYETADQSLVVKIKKEKAKNCKKARCEPGLIVLEKPNAHGACCQWPPKPAEPVKCKFPGQVNPPSCDCPPGLEFMGIKGCMPEKKRWSCRQDHADGPGYALFAYNAVSEGDAVIQFLREVEQRKLVMKGSIHCEKIN